MIDPRGPRFAAAVTTLVLALVLITGSAWLLAAQAVVFALGARDRNPYGGLYRRVVRPRLGPPAELEDPAPVRFAQTVGLAFAAVGLLGAVAGLGLVFVAATAAALGAAFLNAAFGFCLGCQMYLTIRKITSNREGAPA
ncbi:MAG TPA: DUF4395 domain-containing protein [Mycobacteriales bacterium]|nr:DUF4395 domain-containing protein [Mycobacteriales bacterium]